MKRILLIVFLLAGLGAFAQPYNNEWIDYNKTYYKFKVPTTGITRIPQTTLAAMGLSNANADHFQLWHNGQEVPIYTTSTNSPLDASGYIEFWGEMNDGRPDNILYRDGSWQINDAFSLTTDSAAYYLTINPAGNNKRLVNTENNVAGNTLPAEKYFMYRAEQNYRNKVHGGRAELVGSSYTYSSTYDIGEGWSSGDIATNGSASFNFTGLAPYTGVDAPAPRANVYAAGNAVRQRRFRVMLAGDSIGGAQLNYYDHLKYSTEFPISKIASGTALMQVFNVSASSGDRMVVGKLAIDYARTFNFNGILRMDFTLPASAAGNYIEITNFNAGGTIPVMYDITNGKRYQPSGTGSPLRFKLEPSATERRLIFSSLFPNNVRTITELTRRDFIDYSAPDKQGDYLMITSGLLTSVSGPGDPVEEYRQYRSSSTGGGYNAKVYLIDQLEDQFGWGISQNPMSIRNFVHWARANYSMPVSYVLLIGKASTYNQYYTNRAHPDIARLAMVPTFGNPASDNLLTATRTSSIPLVPIGRLSAVSKNEVTAYLNKVKEYEQWYSFNSPIVSDKGWKKNVIHVVGAGDNNTSNLLAAALAGHQQIIEDTLFAANVHTFSKTSADAVEQVASLRLGKLLEEGVSILTYFGHSSSNALEFNLDNPQAYNNPGKYPVMIVMGCNAGSFYNFNTARLQTTETISEKFIFAENRGAIAFMASTHLGIIHYLDIYNTRMYRALSRTHYGATLGELMDEAIRQTFALTTENDFYARFQCEQFTLHGDPALRLYTSEKPDLAVEDPMVTFDPKFVKVSDLEFKVKASFVNLGRSTDRPFVVELTRTYPNLVTEVVRRDTITFTSYSDSLVYSIPVVASRDKGLNKLTFTLDVEGDLDESYETNNSVTKDLYIIEDDISPIYPYEYSIVSDPNVKLIASTANAFAETRTYMVEIDTTSKFNSALKVTRTTTNSGGPIEFNPGISFQDSTVYFWRVAEQLSTGEPRWNSSSFRFIQNGSEGYTQAHFLQHTASDLNRMTIDSVTRRFGFGMVQNSVFARVGVYPVTSSEQAFYEGTINEEHGFIGAGCVYDELIFTVIDSVSFKAWKNNYSGGTGLYNSYLATCGGGREYNFEFLLTDPTWRKRAMDFIDMIPEGNFVLVRTNAHSTTNTYASVWATDEALYGAGNSLYHRLKDQGFEEIDAFNEPRGFAFFFQKDRKDSFEPQWRFTQGIYEAAILSIVVETKDTLGYVTSPVFGPAKAWHEMRWSGVADENDGADRYSFDVLGVDQYNNETLIYSGIDETQTVFDISDINANEFPYVRLRMMSQDSIHFTPFQLKSWQVSYDPVPEGAIAPNIYFSFKDTVEVGEPAHLGIGFRNISKVNFDSVKVKLTILDRDNIEHVIDVPMQKDLKTTSPEDTIRLYVPIDTRNLSGMNTVFVSFNPDFHQPEKHVFNNYAFKTLYVRADSLNPLLDVTFDGVHILNKDIVAARPTIIAELKDEAKWMLLSDTSVFNVQVRYPDGSLRRFSFDTDTLQFNPASGGVNGNKASITFRPHFTEDGEYELLVFGKDKSENFAGFVQYRVAFQVINKPMISNMLNYPNPFTTSTAFVFTLTGSEVPQNIRIQILTITGKIVREITKEELGPLHIGRNITEFKWDGTDQYGQKLANGIYLYRVLTNLNGKSLDKYKATGDNTDKYFNKGYGKMYLMR